MKKIKDGIASNERSIVVLYILMGAAAAIGIVSGIGSTCTTFDSRWWRLVDAEGGSTFGIIEDFQLIFILCYIGTWLAGILWGVLYWGLKTKKGWFYPVALVTSILGIITGILPVAILLYEWWASFGLNGMIFTPSWFRVIANVVLLIFLVLPSIKRGIKAFLGSESASVGGGLGSDVAQFAYVLFGFGAVILAQPFIMPIAHVGANWSDVYDFLGFDFGALLFIVGVSCILLGIIVRMTGSLINLANSKKTSIRT